MVSANSVDVIGSVVVVGHARTSNLTVHTYALSTGVAGWTKDTGFDVTNVRSNGSYVAVGGPSDGSASTDLYQSDGTEVWSVDSGYVGNGLGVNANYVIEGGQSGEVHFLDIADGSSYDTPYNHDAEIRRIATA